MKNNINDLRNHMFAAMELINDDTLTAEQLKVAIDKARALSDLGKVVVESAKTEILYAKMTNNKQAYPTKFLQMEEEPVLQIERPAAVYTNPPYNS